MTPPNPSSPPGSPSSPPFKMNKSLLRMLLEKDTEDYYKEDCPECGEESCFTKIPDYIYENPEEKFAEEIPTWVCSACGYEAFEDDGLEIYLNHMEAKAGRKYNHIHIQNGKKTVLTIH